MSLLLNNRREEDVGLFIDLTSVSTGANRETTSPAMLRYPVYPDNDNTNVLTISLSDINRLRPDQDSNGTDMYLSDTI